MRLAQSEGGELRNMVRGRPLLELDAGTHRPAPCTVHPPMSRPLCSTQPTPHTGVTGVEEQRSEAAPRVRSDPHGAGPAAASCACSRTAGGGMSGGRPGKNFGAGGSTFRACSPARATA